MPKVLNKHKSITSNQAVYIGRPSKWGNPFVIGKDGSRDEVVKLYENHLINNQKLTNDIHELKDKDLVCFCSPKACHGDVLLKYANNS